MLERIEAGRVTETPLMDMVFPTLRAEAI